jgi:small conductance mechanosensitive channel
VPLPLPPASPQTEQLVGWLSGNWVTIVVVALVLFLVWRFARPFIHRGVMGLLNAQERAMPTGSPHEELVKRAATLEDLANRLIRLLLVLAVVFLILGLFDLWSMIAGLGLFLAALTLAGQSVILDYIMGLLIIVEGQYFKGDTIRVGEVEGEVEEVGLRRTVLRDAQGTVHSVSNGTIRVSSNLTRLYAVAMVDLEGVRNRDVEAVIAIMDRVGKEMATDPAWVELIVDAPHYRSTLAFTDLGVTLRMSTRVRTAGRWSVPAELRRRIALALTSADIHLNRRVGTAARTGAVSEDDASGAGAATPR